MGAQATTINANIESSKPSVLSLSVAPVDANHTNLNGSIDQCPNFQNKSIVTPTDTKTYPSECPMSGAGNADINPLNMMSPPNQMPAPDQPFALSTHRVVSNIPKVSDKNENWVITDVNHKTKWMHYLT